ncbi:S9 family peptidase [Eudoraea chungangensis]|uniref:S9 family peptidase n=1 Tax=Eudoraea chungangensis TaxID=1481905 RepID=UPI0023ECE7C6|nr:S9 family peptidase [Eudoraea chungangensis]
MNFKHLLIAFFIAGVTCLSFGQKKEFNYLDVFALKYVSDPQISPNGSWVVYRNMGFDVMRDKAKGNLWLISSDGKTHQKLTQGEANELSPSWSPSGDRIAYIRATEEGSEIYVYWFDTGRTARISQLPFTPSSLSWSPSGNQLAFTMFVSEAPPVLAKMPKKPKGATWAAPPRITNRLYHEKDGSGYIPDGYKHIFIISSEGGAPIQITKDSFQHSGKLSWSKDGSSIYFSANRNENWEYDFRNSDIYVVNIFSGTVSKVVETNGPARMPSVSPDGKHIAYLGYEDKVQAYQVTDLYLHTIGESGMRAITEDFDRSIKSFQWDAKGSGFYVSYDDKGNSKIAHINLSGKITELAKDMGGTSLGRPYAGGSFSVSKSNIIAYNKSTPKHPADLVVLETKNKELRQLTSLNKTLFDHRILGEVEEIWYESSIDKRKIQAWVVYPPHYDKNKKYPLLVENHGGPILNYGDRFSAEMQLYAAAGYIVLYPNARGSTSYGEEFGNLLYNNYPGEDYNDVMDGVDWCIQMGIAHEDKLFVTGGSAGGIMTAWIIGKNNRFEAAVVAKPVMNWISKTLVADNYFRYANSRYPGQPWQNFEGYWKFSPLSLVGNINTPTMVMVGMDDLRTPPSEAKQLYHALKLREIETVLVEIPNASHGIANKPSNLITKIAHTLAWFEKYNTK